MRTEMVEIYSDTTNRAIMKHPGRKFPGLLVQGDTLCSLCQDADDIAGLLSSDHPAAEELNDLRDRLWDMLDHYRNVLEQHEMDLPFSRDAATRQSIR